MSQHQLEGRVEKRRSDEDLELINEGLRAKLAQLEGELRTERTKNAGIDRAVQKIRDSLGPFYNGMRLLFGEMDAIGTSDSEPSLADVDPRKSAVWEDWKRKMPGTPALFINALMIHGELTQTQLRLHAKCAAGSVAGVVSKLWKAGLISKNGGRISLKDV